MVSAPSGAGKTTLCRELRRKVPGLACSISVTPRAPRAGEMTGLEQRLRERRSDNDTDITSRLARAREEIALWRRYDYLIVNRDVKEALDQLEAIVVAERARTGRLTLHFNDLEVPN